MKARTIKAVLRKKLDAWLDTIEDEAVRELARKNSIVTGGSIASMLLREKVNDIDVYFRTYHTALNVAQYYVARFKAERGHISHGDTRPVDIFLADGDGIPIANDATSRFHSRGDGKRLKIVVKSAGVAGEKPEEAEQPYEYFESRPPEEAGSYMSEIMDKPGDIVDKLDDVAEALEPEDGKPKYRPVFLSTNAITLANQVQLIIRFFGEPDEIHANYDFVHCTCYYDGGKNELVLRPDAMEALLTRELRYIGSRYPLCSLIRVRKFIGRGWSINAGQILKMALQLNDLDLKDPRVLEDQLTGVDVAYFAQIIAKVKEEDPEKINSAYLIEIVDRLF